jgi:hypothetical protein
MNSAVPSGPGLNTRISGPGMPARPSFHEASNDFLLRNLANGVLQEYSTSVHDLLRQAVQPVASTLTRTLRELASSYVPAQGLGGSLQFDESLPVLDVPEGPLRAILEHLVEGSLRGNPSVKPYCHVGVVEDTAEKVVLSVRDNGTAMPECGIDELRSFLQSTELRHVPDRVHRLLLADNLVRWLGGRVSLAPTPGADGTTVLLEIPRARVAARRDPLVGRHVF